jgi:hypothetical protein
MSMGLLHLGDNICAKCGRAFNPGDNATLVLMGVPFTSEEDEIAQMASNEGIDEIPDNPIAVGFDWDEEVLIHSECL